MHRESIRMDISQERGGGSWGVFGGGWWNQSFGILYIRAFTLFCVVVFLYHHRVCITTEETVSPPRLYYHGSWRRFRCPFLGFFVSATKPREGGKEQRMYH